MMEAVMWLGPSGDAPDTHKLWADPGSPYEAALKAAGWGVEVSAPGSDEQDTVQPLTEDELTAARELGLPVDDPDCQADPTWVRSELTGKLDDEASTPPVEPPAPKRTRKNRT